MDTEQIGDRCIDKFAPSSLRVDAVWDIETEEWDKFVCGGIWTPAEGVQIYNDESQLAEHLLSLKRGSVAWAHAGGKFDVLWLLDYCRRAGTIPKATIRMSGSSIASLAILGGPVLRDSARLMPMALREACGMFEGSAQKERLSLPCICGIECGGYCAIKRKMKARDRAALHAYLEADILSLRDTLVSLSHYADTHDLLLGGTVASSGWRTAKARCDLQNAEWDLDAYKIARAGYYGGRVEVGRLNAPRVHRFDRRSAYPAELTKPVPCGALRVLQASNAPLAWRRNKPGVYVADVAVPDMLSPPLPIRTANRIVYPHGAISGAWSRDELLNAESLGCRIVRLRGGVAWADERPLLEPHVRHCFALREAAPTKPLKVWLKFLANSLTGAFAQDPSQDIIALGDYADDERWTPVGRYDWIWRRETFRISARGHVHWAATLTAGARVELHRQIVHAGDEWCYSDTDSTIATKLLTRNVGDELGQWANEGDAHDFVALAPKVYTYTTDGGKVVARAKGIPNAEGAWPKIMSGERVDLNRGVDSLLVAARGDSLFQRRDSHRSVSPRDGWCGARIVDGVRTRAPSVAEVADIPR